MTAFIDPTLMDSSAARFPPLSLSATASSPSTLPTSSSYAPLPSRASLTSHRYNPYGGKPRSGGGQRPNGVLNGLREEVVVQPSSGSSTAAATAALADGLIGGGGGGGGGGNGRGWLGSLTGLLGAVVKPFMWAPAPSSAGAVAASTTSLQSAAVPAVEDVPAFSFARPPHTPSSAAAAASSASFLGKGAGGVAAFPLDISPLKAEIAKRGRGLSEAEYASVVAASKGLMDTS